MSVQDRLVAQFRKPTGRLGQLAGWVMAHRPSNRQRNHWTLELLNLQPNDDVLEIGYGPGYAIALASERLTQGRVVGIDHSQAMYAQATRRNARKISEGRVQLLVGDVLDPPTPLEPFDKIYSVNVSQFWPDPEQVFSELKRLLKPGGWIATTFMPRVGRARPGQAKAHARRLQRMMGELQFEEHRVHWLELDPTPALCVVARKPD